MSTETKTPVTDPSLHEAWKDLSTHKTMVCKNHPENRFTSKNPWIRSIFVLTQDCPCPISDLLVVTRECPAQLPHHEGTNCGCGYVNL